ncbi:MAG: ion transporter [Planctomycetota bacterium]
MTAPDASQTPNQAAAAPPGAIKWLWWLTHTAVFRHAVTGLIFLSAVVVGIETYPVLMDRFGGVLKGIDTTIIALFTLEILLRIASHGSRPWSFFKDGWNWFDFIIVIVCLLPAGGGMFAVVRLARVLRVLRLLTSVPRLQVLIGALIHSLPSIGYVALLLSLLFYVYSVLGSMLFGANDPGHFGTLDRAALSLFRAVTLEDWTDLMYTQIYGSAVYPPHISGDFSGMPPAEPQGQPVVATIYFVSFIITGTMIVLNLFIGVVLTSMTEAQAEQAKATTDRLRGNTELGSRMKSLEDRTTELLDELKALREIAERGEHGHKS